MRLSLVETGPSVASSSLSFYLSSSTVSSYSPQQPPFNSPGSLAASFLSPPFSLQSSLSALSISLLSSFFLSPWSPHDPRRVARRLLFATTRHERNGALPVHIDGYFRSRSMGSARRERVVSRALSGAPTTLAVNAEVIACS